MVSRGVEMPQPATYDQIFLFGDSITQAASSQGYASELQNAYIRKVDVVNRGFSGYNTEQALRVLPYIIPSPEKSRIRLLVVFFGANDASVDRSSGQHVPLDEYQDNLEKIVTHPLVQAHKLNVILIAPPPINEYLQGDLKALSRKAVTTKQYADAAVAVGEKLNVPVVNLWKAFMSKTGFDPLAWKDGDEVPGSLALPQNDHLVGLMYDGLHFNPAGYDVLFRELMGVIGECWPGLLPENIDPVLPLWNDAAGWKDWEAAHEEG